MTRYGNCEKCGEPVTSDAVLKSRHPAFPVTGWEVPRDQGGANHIRVRERVPGRVRHVGCLPDPRVHEDQGTLL